MNKFLFYIQSNVLFFKLYFTLRVAMARDLRREALVEFRDRLIRKLNLEGCQLIDANYDGVRWAVRNQWKKAFLDRAALRELWSFWPHHYLPSLPIEIVQMIKEYLGTPKYRFLVISVLNPYGLTYWHAGSRVSSAGTLNFGVFAPGKRWNECTYEELSSIVGMCRGQREWIYLSEIRSRDRIEYREIGVDSHEHMQVLDEPIDMDHNVLEVICRMDPMIPFDLKKFRRDKLSKIHRKLQDLEVSVIRETRKDWTIRFFDRYHPQAVRLSAAMLIFLLSVAIVGVLIWFIGNS
jgi:hypothetical protein